MPKITNISSIQVLDSRGTPTLRSFVTLDNKYTGISTVPSGASTGKYEAIELRDNNYQDFFGKSINSCIENIQNIISPKIINSNFDTIQEFDEVLLALDNSNILKKPLILLLKYVSGFSMEYLTPAWAAKLITPCGLCSSKACSMAVQSAMSKRRWV